MTDKEQQESFTTRLKRIEARQNGEAPDQPEMAIPLKEPSRFDTPPQEDVFVRNALIWLAITITAVVGGAYGIQALPQDLKDTLAWMTGVDNASSETKTATDPPTQIVETDSMAFLGPVLASPAIASLRTDNTDLSAVAINVSLPDDETQIGQVIPFDRNASCMLRKPLAAEAVVNVRIDNGLLPAPVQAFSAAALSDQLMQNVTAVTQDGQIYDHSAQVDGTLTTVDVFLTDTSAPLYLVLQNMGPGIVWNIHAGPNVTVAHVAIIAAQTSGLANIDDATTFDAVLVSDFVTPYSIGDDDQPRDCMIRPWRNPQADWLGNQAAAAGDTTIAAQMQSYTKGYAAYNTWFTDTFGIDASTDVITAKEAAHVLYGPLPVDALRYRPLDGQDIHLMRTEHIIIGDDEARSTTVANLHEQTLLAAVSGDISSLNPAPIERDDQ